jgi:ATP-dependent Clp protease ATP-binding subunit ClpA
MVADISLHLAITPRVDRILKRAYYWTEAIHDNVIGTEHLLLALLEDRDAIATQVLAEFVDLGLLKARMHDFLANEYRVGPGGKISMKVSDEAAVDRAGAE